MEVQDAVVGRAIVRERAGAHEVTMKDRFFSSREERVFRFSTRGEGDDPLVSPIC